MKAKFLDFAVQELTPPDNILITAFALEPG